MPSVRELEISHVNSQTTVAAAAALDDVAGPDRETAGQTIYMGTHDNLRGEDAPSSRRVMPDHGDSSETM